MKRITKNLLSLFALIGLLVTPFSALATPITATPIMATPSFPDLSGHWAGGYIDQWTKLGFIGGYPDGTFGPNNSITKAEFIALVNRVMGYTEMVEVGFPDVAEGAWFKGDVLKSIAAGYSFGYDDGTFRPNEPLSREEAAVMIYNIMKLENTEADNMLAAFADVSGINPDYKAALNTAVACGYLGGYPDKTIGPKRATTRAEMIVILDRIAGAKYLKAGTYGPAEGQETIAGNATVSKPDVTLQNLIIEGDLHLTEGIGEGDCHLYNVSVKGRTLIGGGGTESIHISGEKTNLGTLEVNSAGCELVRIVIDDREIVIDEIMLRTGAIIELPQADGTSIGTLTIAPHAGRQGEAQQFTISGSLGKVVLQGTAGGPPINLTITEDASIEELLVDESAAAAQITSAGQVGQLTINAPNVNLGVTGGSIGTLTATEGAEGSEITIDEGAAVTTTDVEEDKDITVIDHRQEETPAGPEPDSGGPVAPSRTPVRAISVTGDTSAGSILTAETTPANATGNYQWLKADAADGEYSEIAGATAKTYTLTNEDVDQYIKVKIAGTGNYTGNPISEPSEKIEKPAQSTYMFTYEIPESDVLTGVPVEIPVTTEYDILGQAGYDSVLIKFEGKSTEGDGRVTFKIMEHSSGTEYSFEGSGQWGPADGWPLDADFQSTNAWTLIFPAEGVYAIKFWLEDQDADEDNKIIVEAMENIMVRDEVYSEYKFQIGSGDVPGFGVCEQLVVLKVDQLVGSNSLIVPSPEGKEVNPMDPIGIPLAARGVLASTLSSDGAHNYDIKDLQSRMVNLTLKPTDIKDLGYDEVWVRALIAKEGQETEELQVWMYAMVYDGDDQDNHNKWWNIAKPGWSGDEKGLKLDPDEDAEMNVYVFSTGTPGTTYEITFEAVAVDSGNPSEPELVIATGTTEVTLISVSLPEKAYYDEGEPMMLTIEGLPGANPLNEKVKIGMPIFLGDGFGWPWASDERVLKDMIVEPENGHTIRWAMGEFKTGGLLYVEGIIGPDGPCKEPPCPDLPYGELHITLPEYGRFIDHPIRLRPMGREGDASVGVTVGFAVGVEGHAVVGETLTATVLNPANADIIGYQWMRSDEQWAPDDAYEVIENADQATYELTNEDLGKCIKVKVIRQTTNCDLYVLSVNEIGPVE